MPWAEDEGVQWDVYDTDQVTHVAEAKYGCTAVHTEEDYGGGDYDASMLMCLSESFNENTRVRVERGVVWDADCRLQPWKQLFIGYAKNALVWAKGVTGEQDSMAD